ncbi:hypothetical protein C0993_008572 [Termitomyces sp. T159_Od127]|nr:hypothetical protein C0993_008572 [Termitomyces sp. T159_Od127]
MDGDSPPPRTILSSLLRGRPRTSTIIINTDLREVSPPPSSLSNMLRRRRSAGTIATPTNPAPAAATAPSTSAPSNNPAASANPHRIRLVPHIDSRRTLRFEAITRDLVAGAPALRIGRFTDRTGLGLAAVNALGTNRLAFKSKVVSRAHAEIWVESGGRFFIKDTKSSSGTFLNHVRLSPANTESRPFQMKDGDILQLGVDYQGGTEDIYKSVKIRIEVGREWQSGANAFNTNTLKILKTLQQPPANAAAAGGSTAPAAKAHQIPDCCICLFGVTIRQALFIAPCSHTFHYKCIRPLLETHHPAFSCPLCRTFADLEEDVEIDADADADAEAEAEACAAAAAAVGQECAQLEEGTPAPGDAHAHLLALATVPIAEADELYPYPYHYVEGDAEAEDEMRGVESEASGSAIGVGLARPGESPAPAAGDEMEVDGPGRVEAGPGAGADKAGSVTPGKQGAQEQEHPAPAPAVVSAQS